MYREECEDSELNSKTTFIYIFSWQIIFKSASLQHAHKDFISWEQA